MRSGRARRGPPWPRRPLLSVLLLLCLLAACAPPALLRREGWDGGDVEGLLRGDFDALLAVGDLTAEVELTLHRAGGRDSAHGSILYRPPDLFRLDLRGALFQHLLTAVLHADTLLVLAGDELHQSPAAGGLGRYLDIDLGDYDPRYLLLGAVLPGRAVDAEVAYPRADQACLTLLHGDGRRRLWLDLKRGFVEREELLDGEGQVRWTRRLSGYRRLTEGAQAYLPGVVRIEGGGRALVLSFGAVAVNRGLPRDVFFRGLEGVAASPYRP